MQNAHLVGMGMITNEEKYVLNNTCYEVLRMKRLLNELTMKKWEINILPR